MKSLANTFFLALGIIVIVWSFYTFLQKPAPERFQDQSQDIPRIMVGQETIPVEIAETDDDRRRGLSGRESLTEGQGILFIFDEPNFYPFWMREMKFPIDIVWISEEWLVVGVEKGIMPETFPETFIPPSPAKYVLELNSGEAETFGIDTGVEVYLER